MRALVLSIVLLALATSINCFPESRVEDTTAKDGKPQIAFVPLEANPNIHRKEPSDVADVDSPNNYGDQPIVDTGMFSFNPFYANPLSGFLSSIESMMTRMRQQMSEVLSRLPDTPESDPAEEQPGIISLFPRFKIPEGKGNTTSVTKIIDGHKVVINETTYSSNGNNSGSFFKVRIVDIKPNEDENLPTEKDSEPLDKATTAASPTPKRDIESIEESIENEIPKGSQKEEYNDIETFEENLHLPKIERPENLIFKDQETGLLGDFDAVEPFDNNSVEENPPVIPGHDLSGDIFVNQLMADAGAQPNVDAEIFNPEMFRSSLMRNNENVEMLKK